MMNSKRNQTIAIARFLMYKHSLNQQLDGMTDEEYLADPIGLDVGSYVKDLMRYCPENVVDQVMEHQDALLRRLGTDYLSVIAFMMYAPDLSKWLFNQMLGMGDMEHNRKLREERENKRPIITDTKQEIALWNIWVYYQKDIMRRLAQQKNAGGGASDDD